MKIAVLGGGCWGVTLANHLFQRGNHLKGNKVALWEYDKDKTKILDKERRLYFLPHLRIPKGIFISSELKKILQNKETIVFAIPAKYFRATAKKVSRLINSPVSMLVNGTKGLENNTFKRMSQILEEELPKELHKKIAVLSGPSHAEEVSKGIPTAVTVAGKNKEVILQAQKLFFTPTFRVYTNSDLLGVELAGALKNIYAIACGVSDGLGLGDNTKSALVTRGLAEMIRLGTKIGAKVSTFYGLAGIGDLIVTCFSHWSRNRNFGEKIGQGKSVQQALKEIGMTVEGVETSKTVYYLSRKMKIDMPIVNEVYLILYKNKKPRDALQDLLLRSPKSE